VLDDPAKAPQEAANVLLIVAFKHYWESWSDHRRNPADARRTGRLLLDYLGDDATVGRLTKARQEAFMRWLATEHDHSVATISRHLSIVSAALHRAAEPHVVAGPDGTEIERRILAAAPKIYYGTAHIAEVVDKPEPAPRAWRPSLEELGRFIDAIESEALFRDTLLALNTWARPEAICDIDPARQVDAEHRRLDLNPPGRRQTKKYRPIIPITDCLWGWLQAWPATGRLVANPRLVAAAIPGAPPTVAYEPVASVRKAFEGTRERAGVPQLTRYALRHLMASRASNDPAVPEKQIDLWMGHRRPDAPAGRWYRHLEPDYLREAREFTDRFMAELQRHCRRRLFAPAEGAAGLVPLIPQRERIRRQYHGQQAQEPAASARRAGHGHR
jgi:integrase